MPFGEVQSVEVIYQTQWMYNITVDTAHTYFVGDGQWLVHNACDDLYDDIIERGEQYTGRYAPRTSDAPYQYKMNKDRDITKYTRYDAKGRPNYQVEITGKSHAGVDTPHTHYYELHNGYSKRIRIPEKSLPWQIPRR